MTKPVPLCLASVLSIWSKNFTPVSISIGPPSSSRRRVICVSFVFRSTAARRPFSVVPQAWPTPVCPLEAIPIHLGGLAGAGRGEGRLHAAREGKTHQPVDQRVVRDAD